MSNNDFQIKNGVLKKYTGTDTNVVIPDGVKRIGDNAFSYCESLVSVIIPNGVKKIGEYAFYGCKNLELIEVPDSVENIDNAAFCNLHFPVTISTTTKTVSIMEKWNLIDPFGSDIYYKILLKVKLQNSTACVFLVDKYSEYDIDFFLDNNTPDMEKYDRFVETNTRYKTYDIICAAFARLTYPYELKEEHEMFYRDFLDKNIKKAITTACENNNVDWLKVLLEYKIINSTNFKKFSSVVRNASSEIADFFAAATIPEITVKKEEKSAVSNHPIESFCKENFNEKEINAIIKKSVPSTRHLENVKYKDDSGKASEFVVKCAIAPYIAQMESRPKQIGGYKKDIIRTRFEPLSDKVAEALETESFLDMLEKIAKDADCKAPQCFIPLGRFGTPEQINTIISKMNEWKDWDTYSSSGRSAIIVARGALMLCEYPVAVQMAEKTGNFWRFAGMRGLSEQEYRDEKTLPDIGFDADGVKRYHVGGKTYEVRIGSTLTLELTLDGKSVKSIPKKTPEGEVAATDFAAKKKEFADFIKKRIEYIKSIYITGEKIPAESWLRTYGSKTLLLPFTERVIWQNGKNVLFEVTDGKIRDVNGNEYTPDEPVRIAHVLDMKCDEIQQWQSRIIELQKTLLIEQIWEPVVSIKKSDDICSRYEGAVLTKEERNRFKNSLKSKGIVVKSEEQGYDPYRHTYGTVNNTMIIGDTIRLDYSYNESTSETTLGKMSKEKLTRKTNTVFFELDRLVVKHHIVADDVDALTENILNSFTLAQITEFIDIASSNNSTNCTALLMDYRNKTFNEVDPFSMFVL